MSVDTRPVPVTLLRWPRTRDLITQHKAILLYLWPNPSQTACGCYLLPVEATAADLSMTASSLVDALSEFERRGLISQDSETGEIFVCDWFRFYQPRTTKARWAVEAAIQKVLSPKLKQKVEKSYKSMVEGTKEKEKEKEEAAVAASSRARARETPALAGGGAAAAPSITSTPTPTAGGGGQQGKARRRRQSGIVTWNDNDIQEAELIEQMHDATDIDQAIDSLTKQCLEPVPGRVEKELERLAREREAARRAEERRAAAREAPRDLQAVERGRAFIERVRARREGLNQEEMARCAM